MVDKLNLAYNGCMKNIVGSNEINTKDKFLK